MEKGFQLHLHILTSGGRVLTNLSLRTPHDFPVNQLFLLLLLLHWVSVSFTVDA